MKQEQLNDLIDKTTQTTIDSAFDIPYRVLDQFGVTLYENQIEIIEDIIDLSVDKLFIAQARAAGKTFAVELGFLLLCIDNPEIKVGIIGPKQGQATKFLKEAQKIIKNTPLESEIDWSTTSASIINFKNGSFAKALSGAKTAEVEGEHFDMIIIDEAHRVSSFSFQNKIIPMLGGSEYSNIVKLGVTMFKNHFRDSGKPNSPYKKLIRSWTECPYLLRGGSVVVDGVEYSKFVLDRMPLALKKEFFPNRPDLHYEGDQTITDFLTQYMMEWADELNTFLSEPDQDKLIGTHRPQKHALTGRTYFYGLDTQQGSLDPTNLSERDYTALSIWEKTSNNKKLKVAAFEWQQDPLDQQEEIEYIITKLFPCKFGLVEYSNNGVMMLEAFKAKDIPGDGVVPHKTERNTGLNFKNAMYTQFKYELRHNRVKYPEEVEIEKDVVLKEHYNQWCMLERISTTGINDKIRHPEGEHDDGTDADAMAVYAADKTEVFKQGRKRSRRIPKPVTGVQSLSRPRSSGSGQTETIERIKRGR